MNPTSKSLGINRFLKEALGFDREKAITSNRCAACHADVSSFRDAISEREYRISGLCQTCQDEIFG